MSKRREKQVRAKANPRKAAAPVRQPKEFQRKLTVTGQTANQKQLIRTIEQNKITLVHGPAGTGKTHIATSMAIIALLKNEVKRIIITRPLVQSGEDTGFLPGDIKKKLDPYMRPLYDELYQYVSYSELQELFNSDMIEICPFAYMRGRNFHNTYIVADECQNASYSQLRMLVTRIGRNSTMVLTGDSQQSDLPSNKQGAFETYMKIMGNVPNVGVVHLEKDDIVREEVVEDMIKAIEDYEKNSHEDVGIKLRLSSN